LRDLFAAAFRQDLNRYRGEGKTSAAREPFALKASMGIRFAHVENNMTKNSPLHAVWAPMRLRNPVNAMRVVALNLANHGRAGDTA
jgi:hypothetical protein